MLTGMDTLFPLTDIPLRWCSNQIPQVSQSHYNAHMRRGEPPCSMASHEKGLYIHWWKFGTLADYRPQTDFLYDCLSQIPKPGPGHYGWHRYHRTDPCQMSRYEFSLHKYHRKHGTLADYQKPFSYDCKAAPVAPSRNHYAWHRTHKTKPCLTAQFEHALFTRMYLAGDDLGDYKVRQFTDGPTKVYQITFLSDNARYYGRTRKPDVEKRVQQHARNHPRLAPRIKDGEIYRVEQLCEAPDWRTAGEIEVLAIKSGNPWGPLLNSTHNV